MSDMKKLKTEQLEQIVGGIHADFPNYIWEEAKRKEIIDGLETQEQQPEVVPQAYVR